MGVDRVRTYRSRGGGVRLGCSHSITVRPAAATARASPTPKLRVPSIDTTTRGPGAWSAIQANNSAKVVSIEGRDTSEILGVVLSSARRVKKGPGRRPQSAKRQRFVEL